MPLPFDSPKPYRKTVEAPDIRVFIIEDQIMVSEVILHYCELSGCIVVGTASTCQEAFDLLLEKPIEVVVIDLVLPDGSGFEIARYCRRELPGVRILLISGDLNSAALEIAKTIPVDGIIDKTTDSMINVPRAVEVVNRGGIYLSRSLRDRVKLL
jgi:DNA-binding NarL/FixJ family response regulator